MTKALGGSLAFVVLIACATACDDVYVDADRGGDGFATGGGSSSGKGEPDGFGSDPDESIATIDTSLPCPEGRPRENTRCLSTGSVCEYGDEADRRCNALLACRGGTSDGAWERFETADRCWGSMCPSGADVASLDGTPCELPAEVGAATDADEAVCNMTDGVCACTTGRDAATAHSRKWICVRPVSDCPRQRPLAGSPCSGGLWCDYGSCAFKNGLLMECVSGHWRTGGKTCQ